MQKVNVSKDELKKVVSANLAKHKAEHKEACQGFNRDLTDRLTKALALAKNGDNKSHRNLLPLIQPESHEKDYNTVISMLDASADSIIELDTEAFKNYYLDQWHWTESFKNSTSIYNNGK